MDQFKMSSVSVGGGQVAHDNCDQPRQSGAVGAVASDGEDESAYQRDPPTVESRARRTGLLWRVPRSHAFPQGGSGPATY